MNRQNYYYRQKVSEVDLDNLENNLEGALKNTVVDLFGVGMVAGGDVVPNSPTPDMSVIVTSGKGYDFLGQRISWGEPQNVDCSRDQDGVSTAVSGPGKEKWITVLAYFARVYSDPRVDGHGNVVYFREDEGFTFKVIQGAEAPVGAAVRPAHPTDGGLILADILLEYGITAITADRIDKTRYEAIVTHTADEIQVTDPDGRFAGQNVEAVLAELDQAHDSHSSQTTSAHGGIVAASEVVTTPQANKILKLNAQAKLPASITGDADTVDGQHASAFAPASHVGAGGSAHGVATGSTAGFMSAADKAKLDGIQAGAEVNQNAFSQVKVGATTIDADSKMDVLELVAGTNIAITPDPVNDKVTFAVTGAVAQAQNADTLDGKHSSDFADASHVGAGGSAHAAATASTAGFMSAADKAKLDGIQAGAEVNQNAFSQVKVGATTIDADSKMDVLELVAGANIALTPDAANDKITIAVTGTVPQATNADTVDNLHASAFAPASHVGATGTAHGTATSSVAGFMSAADKVKLDGIQAGAEVNQNAFSNVKVGATVISAGLKTDTIEFVAGTNISLTPDATGKKVTVAFSGSTSGGDADTVDGQHASALAESAGVLVNSKRAAYAVYAP